MKHLRKYKIFESVKINIPNNFFSSEEYQYFCESIGIDNTSIKEYFQDLSDDDSFEVKVTSHYINYIDNSYKIAVAIHFSKNFTTDSKIVTTKLWIELADKIKDLILKVDRYSVRFERETLMKEEKSNVVNFPFDGSGSTSGNNKSGILTLYKLFYKELNEKDTLVLKAKINDYNSSPKMTKVKLFMDKIAKELEEEGVKNAKDLIELGPEYEYSEGQTSHIGFLTDDEIITVGFFDINRNIDDMLIDNEGIVNAADCYREGHCEEIIRSIKNVT